MNNLEEINSSDNVFPLADKYANTGFNVLSDYMKKYDDRALAIKLIADMDEMNAQFLADMEEK